MPPDLSVLRADLRAEQLDLHTLLSGIEAGAWDAPTPAAGWTVRHQVRHLAHGEELGRLAASEAAAFAAELQLLMADLAAIEAATTAPEAEDTDDLLARWWDAAEGLRASEAEGPQDEPIDWITGPMSRASFLTARVMETFAHGHEIAVAVGVVRPVTARLRHVAHLGVATRGFSFANRGLAAPEQPVRVELAAPDGTTWTWGPEDAADRVTGDALDFCLVVTQRAPWRATDLAATGPDAARWLDIAQCFAGPPTTA